MKTVSYHIPCAISFQGKGKALPVYYLHYSAFNLNPAGQPEHDPVLGIHRHAVNQRGPQAGVELGDELQQGLHALDEPLDLPALDHDLVDLLDDRIASGRYSGCKQAHN